MIPPYEIRPLRESDYDEGFFECLSELTQAPKVNNDEFIKRFKKLNYDYIVLVAYHKNDRRVIGTGVIFFEYKFIRNLAIKGYIEDIVVCQKYRGLKIGKKIVEKLTEIGLERKCYKIVLSCDEKNIGFYKACGFEQKEVQMVIYNNKSNKG
ncbi:Glucosamine 6-phosphate N-acetyltransferase 1 [Dictyocoela muelleri]|nr:Glucosamine 6-phosphate N-acetyltransferase 1 [Dictyocoela muelleri]